MAKKRPFSFSAEPELWEKVQQEAARQGKKVSDIVVEALHQYLYNVPAPNHFIPALQEEIAKLSAELHIERARTRALTKEIKSLRSLLAEMSRTMDSLVKEAVAAKKESADVARRERELLRRERYITQKEQEISRKLAELDELERKLKALNEHVQKREEEILIKESLVRVALGKKALARWVREVMDKLEYDAMSFTDITKRVSEIYLAFTEEELEKIVESWPIIAETRVNYIRDAGEGLHYRQLIQATTPLKGVFILAEKDIYGDDKD